MKVKGYILAAIAATSYGLIPLFILPLKASSLALDSSLFYRFFISALFILPYLIRKKESLKVNTIIKKRGSMFQCQSFTSRVLNFH